MEAFRDFITSNGFLGTWLVLMAVSVAWLIYDLHRFNPQTKGMMKWVWLFTVFYSGPLGLAIYFYSGRRQIPHDSPGRRGFRSTAHCYSGCGLGEIVGMILTVGLLALGNLWVALVTFSFAYIAGFGMTLGPLLQDGVPFREAMKDAFYSESASIFMMELVAISVDLWIAPEAQLGDRLFWAALVVSLSAGYVAAFPVNLWLISRGVKAGMHSPG